MNQKNNVTRLILHKMSLIAIPVGSGENSFALGLEAFAHTGEIYQQARDWAQAAIAAVKAAPDCTYTTDEEIAGVILAKINAPERDAETTTDR